MMKILRMFYSFLFEKRAVAAIFLLLVTVSSVASSIQPYFYKLLVDAIPSLNYQKLLTILLFYMGVRVIRLLTNMSSFYMGDVLVINALAKVRETIFAHVHNLDFAFHANKSSGSLISAMKRGDGAFWNFYFSLHYRLYNVLISFFVMLYFFKSLDTRIFYLTIVSILLALLVTRFFLKANIRTRKKVNSEEDKISAVIVDNMINFETVKLFAKEFWEQIRMRKTNKRWKDALWKYALTFRGLDVALGLVINTSIFFLLLFTLKLAIAGSIGVGDFVLVVGFSGSFYPKLWELVWGFRDIATNYTDIEKYFGLLDNEIEVKDPAKPVKTKNIKGEVAFENISFTYENKQADAIRSLSLKIKDGESVALVGRSGAGKTTMAKLLMRFFDVDKGKITVGGINVKEFKKSDLRSFMGVVPQEPVLFNNTLVYNITYGRTRVSKKEMVAASKLAKVHEFVQVLPKKYQTQVGERGIKLSGGQKQRVAIARMILSKPEIIIFDEATSQLDSESERLIQEAFWKASEGKTTIIIAHRLSTVMRADKIVVMEKGKIVEMGSHEDLINQRESLYKHFWDLQLAG